MPELRQDPITLDWVAIAVERAKRPHTFTQAPKVVVKASEECPFCTGRESETPPEVMAYREPAMADDGPGWKVRVVPNLYPAFGPAHGELNPRHVGPYLVMGGLGVHEVLINNPEHYKDLGQLPLEDVSLVVKAYVDRLLAHKDNPVVRYMLIIVNHGREAGASREHPHAQLFGIPLIPPYVAQEIQGLKRYRQEKETCGYCDMISYESRIGHRMIYENDAFVVFAPFASRVPFESWVFPRYHSSRFETMNDYQQHSFADALRNVLGKLYYGLNDPPFNLYIHTAPYRDLGDSDYHWHVEIRPKLSIAAGFELGAGIMINTALPESAAEFLRLVAAEDIGHDRAAALARAK
ncbi:MAG: DUF4921 family protein [Chloroflexi bacterium]|nr:DUF4921 family protein [Chloroflexota bacterium]